MKTKLLFTVLVLCGLTGCVPQLHNSSEGLGKSKISFMLHTVTSPSSMTSAYKLQPYMKEKMAQYCEQQQLSQKLQQCLIEMGMTCDKQICRYHGYMTSTISFPFQGKISENTRYYMIEVDAAKGWDSFSMNDKFERREFK